MGVFISFFMEVVDDTKLGIHKFTKPISIASCGISNINFVNNFEIHGMSKKDTPSSN